MHAARLGVFNRMHRDERKIIFEVKPNMTAEEHEAMYEKIQATLPPGVTVTRPVQEVNAKVGSLLGYACLASLSSALYPHSYVPEFAGAPLHALTARVD